VNIRNHAGSGDPGADLEDGWRFLAELTSTVRAEFPRAVLVAEDLQTDPRITAPVDDGGLGFHLQWAADFVHPVRAALEVLDDLHRDLDAVVAALAGGADAGARVVYTESHDEVANGRTRVPAEIDPEAPDAVHAIRRSVAGGVLTMAALGVPMLFQGQEWADEDWFDDAVDVRWQRREERSGLVTLWGDLVRLRSGVDDRAPGLRGDRIDVRHHEGVVSVRRWGLGGEDAACLAVANLTGVERRVGLPAGPGGWTCVFAADWSGYHESGEDRTGIVDGEIVLPAYGSAILAPVV
jgi:1,4-alpha-glucan branching enzyme